jgi:hypothetical protein
MNFIRKVINGQAKPEDIDKYVHDWHCDMNTALTISEYLGMTDKEYKRWVENPEALQAIIEEHKHGDKSRPVRT